LKLAAIDIGSNAIRLLINRIWQTEDGIKVIKESLIRVPVRLGEASFTTGQIGLQKEKKLIKTFKAFKNLMDIYEVEDFMVCATSAMREAENHKEIIKRVEDKTGIHIEVIDGKKEAELILSTMSLQKLELQGDYLYIDVGGGSTEISYIKNGVPKKSKSFKIGTVRSLKNKVKEDAWERMRNWIATEVETMDTENLIAIGTGGNINKLFKLAGIVGTKVIKTSQLQTVVDKVNSLTYDERIEQLGLKPDRADVIVPASKIYMDVLNQVGIKKMIVPKLGLSDGMILKLFKELNN
jgi:exopolyphosphatase/guanosine-5'-triphosphate,3'-diphosphate pyrophosphatase